MGANGRGGKQVTGKFIAIASATMGEGAYHSAEEECEFERVVWMSDESESEKEDKSDDDALSEVDEVSCYFRHIACDAASPPFVFDLFRHMNIGTVNGRGKRRCPRGCSSG